MSKKILRVGFVGVGAIATAIVDALMSGPHADEIDVVLSPRSAPRSAELCGAAPSSPCRAG
jgi:pyrroline-5-carboxylate reductase